jgi:hypothetical protein
MADDFNIDDVLGQFEKQPAKAASKSSFDIDKILSDFGVKSEPLPKDIKKVIIDTSPKPPISGVSKEASDEFNQTVPTQTGGENPRRLLPATSVQESMAEHGIAAKALLGSAAADLETGHPYKGAGKAALGLLAGAASPVTGAIEGAVATPITDITGSKDIGDRAAFVAGSAIPVVPGGSAVVKALPKNKALSTLVENIGQENLPAVVSAMKANPRLAPADLSPRVLQDTQHLFTSEGPQIDYLAKTSADRMASSKGAINSAYDTNAGISPDLAKKMSDLAASSKKVGETKINPAVTNAGAVDITNTLAKIDEVLKPGVHSVVTGETSLPLTAIKKELVQIKNMLANDKEMRTGAPDLHKFQAGLRRQAEGLKNSASGAEREMGNALMNIRNSLVSDIDKAAGGNYKPALSSYRDEMNITEAFKDGYEGLFSSSKKMENTPSFTKQWFDGLNDFEKQAAREGARAAIATEIGVAKNPALVGESLMRSDFNKAKLEILFGKDEAGKLIKLLQDERNIANTHNKIVEGSQTAMRSASKSQFALPTKTEVMKSAPAVAMTEGANFFLGGTPGFGSAILAGAKGAAMAKDAIRMKLAREHNAQYAKYALPTEGPSRDELIRRLEARMTGPKPSLLSRSATAASKIIP